MRNQLLHLKCLKHKPLKCIHLKCIDHKFTYCKCKYLKRMHLVFLLVFNLDYSPSDWVEHTFARRKYYYNKRTRQSSWVKTPKLMTPIKSRKPENPHNIFGPFDHLLTKEVKVKDMEENEDRPVLTMIIDANVSCNP
ncbi:hypothetical protein PVL29_026926 [Vitis rotundifolia]|uniref:WW domain-containing protein n=1 Tax=Vitis rotundifolia TaxID=103349 RepID=A0AA38YHS7_VITRO|nr:hypothetical protein PVL29_026926 [Vitis rotundifolia]